MRTTITDVARHAGVSPSTVSHVLSGNRTISPETRARVQRSIRALNYRAHAGARSLRAGQTDVVGLVVPLQTCYYQRVLMPYVYGVTEAARAHGWNVMLLTATDGKAEIERAVYSNMVDGLVLMEVQLHDERVPLVAGLGRPAVLLGMPADPAGLAYVDFDFEAAANLCVEHLVGLGHRAIGFVGGPQSLYDSEISFALRTQTSVAARLSEHGLEFHGVAAEPNPAGVQLALRSLLDQTPELTGLIVKNEWSVDLIVDALNQLGRKVPRDTSVVVIAGQEVASQVSPALTYVRIPAEELGRAAVELLSTSSGDAPREGVLVPPELVRRGSDAPLVPAQSRS